MTPWGIRGRTKVPHGSGFFGPNERPAVLELGEEVLRRGDPRHMLNGGLAGARGGLSGAVSQTVTIAPQYQITTSSGGSKADAEEIQRSLKQSNADLERVVKRPSLRTWTRWHRRCAAGSIR